MKELPDISISLRRLWEILDDEYFYELLPGNGIDDYVIEWLKQTILEAAKAEKRVSA